MFGLFKRKSPIEKLQVKYNKLMKDYHEISKVNRKEAEKYYVQAETILTEIKAVQSK